jgi:hypothetical protein
MRSRLILFTGLVLLCTSIYAQQAVIGYSPVSCLPAGQFALVSATIETPGTPRMYFRVAGTEDWCFVDGTRVLDIARFILPKFQAGTQLEYYFVVLDGNKVTAKSPQIYRVAVTERCDTPASRHMDIVQADCEQGGVALGSSMGAAYMIEAPSQPPDISPSQPGG